MKGKYVKLPVVKGWVLHVVPAEPVPYGRPDDENLGIKWQGLS